MAETDLKHVVEAALLAAGEPLSVERIRNLYPEGAEPEKQAVRAAVEELAMDYRDRGIEVKEVASGFRIQVRENLAPWVSRLWEERPPKYSRALLETLAIIAYRQPITRGEIEEVRGVSVSSQIMRTLQERGWVRVIGHRDVPGRPAILATTRQFLDYFNLKSLDQLPSLMAVRNLDEHPELDLRFPEEDTAGTPEGEDATLTDADEQTRGDD
ncbi:SMC-Scp complex subunit ScpB [Ectothiorhodospiraceae bacterium WFHF3C12]|nr:SMC-Scp complex subunit ScpB [Ectothiorhodospiraceae bacterium WFHF3C12]